MSINGILDKYKKIPLPVKAGIWFTICNLLQRGISILTVPIFTRLLTPDQYGVYSLYLSWLNILTIFTSLNLYYGVFNKAMVKYERDRERYISSMQGLVIVLCGVSFLIYLIFQHRFNNLLELNTSIVCMMFLEMLMMPAIQFWMSKKRFEYDYRPIVKVSLLKSVLNPGLGIIFVMLFEYKAEARIFAIVLVETIIGMVVFIKQFKKGKCFYVKEYWLYAVKFNIPLIPHYLSGSVLNQGDRIVIQKMIGGAAVALYSVAYNVAMLSQLVTNAIAQAITPWLYNSLKRRDYDQINNKLKPIMILVALVSCGLMLLAPEIVWIFASKEYREAVYVIPPIAASVFFIYMYNVYSNFEFYYEKKGFIAIASIVAAGLNIVLNIVFIPLFGYVAAGYTTLFCYMVYAFAHFFFSRYICLKEIGNIKIFELRDFLICSIGVSLFSFLSELLYVNYLVRYFIILLLLIIAFNKRNIIFRTLKGIRNNE